MVSKIIIIVDGSVRDRLSRDRKFGRSKQFDLASTLPHLVFDSGLRGGFNPQVDRGFSSRYGMLYEGCASFDDFNAAFKVAVRMQCVMRLLAETILIEGTLFDKHKRRVFEFRANFDANGSGGISSSTVHRIAA